MAPAPTEPTLELSSVADELPIGLWVVRAPGGETMYANRAMRELLGRPLVPNDGSVVVRGSFQREDGTPFPDDELPFTRALRERRVVQVAGLYVGRLDGTRIRTRAVASPFPEGGGAPRCVLLIVRDMGRDVARDGAEVDIDDSEGLERELGRAAMQRLARIVGGLTTSGEEAAPPEAPLGHGRARRPRVLVVDDDVNLTRVFAWSLADDYDVQATSDPREALELLLGEAEFDLVLCDVMMHQLSGAELYEQLREKKPGKERRLVLMTGGAFTDEARAFLDSVPNLRFTKPFIVTRVVEQALRALEVPNASTG